LHRVTIVAADVDLVVGGLLNELHRHIFSP
jgi:hypothetical protein